MPEPVVAIIPARMASTRFPGKMLAADTGKPLIQHVHERVNTAASLSRVLVATDDERIAKAVRGFGGECIMTDEDHPNGTSRLAQAAALLGLSDSAIVVNVQGDEPEIETQAIDEAVGVLLRGGVEVATIASPFAPREDPTNPSIVKVVLRADGTAMYFSRSRIPHVRQGGTPAPPLRHVGIYVYRVAFLRQYAALAPTPLEQAESLEQLRVLEHGYRIGVGIVACSSQGIDTPEQYAAFVKRCRG